MELKEQKGAGLSLIVGSLLMIVTMVLHPVGGDFNHLVKIFTMGKIAHGIAILSLPFVTYGFWGLINEEDILSIKKPVSYARRGRVFSD